MIAAYVYSGPVTDQILSWPEIIFPPIILILAFFGTIAFMVHIAEKNDRAESRKRREE